MKITTLEYFIAVAEAGSIRAAAQKLYLAQPSLTKSLQSMEQELGVQLFTRTSSGIRLTIAGETILPQARQVIALYNGWLELGTVTSLKKWMFTVISLWQSSLCRTFCFVSVRATRS